MATPFSILVWNIPWTEEPGGLQSMGLQSGKRLSMGTSRLAQVYPPHPPPQATSSPIPGLLQAQSPS